MDSEADVLPSWLASKGRYLRATGGLRAIHQSRGGDPTRAPFCPKGRDAKWVCVARHGCAGNAAGSASLCYARRRREAAKRRQMGTARSQKQ